MVGVVSLMSSEKIEGVFSVKVLEDSQPLLGRLVKMEYKRMSLNKLESGFLYARITHYELITKLEPESALIDEILKNDVISKNMKMYGYALKVYMTPITAISLEKKRMQLDTPVKLGTKISFVEDNEIKDILPEKVGFSFLGTFWGSDVKAPIFLEDFERLNEAYHFLIAGQTGSGKSTLAKMILSLYAKKSRSMNFLIIDPVGEFTNSFRSRDEFDLRKVWETLRRDYEIFSPENIAFDSKEILKELLLKSKVPELLSIRRLENAKIAVERIVELITQEFTLDELESQIEAIMIDIQKNIDSIAKEIYVTRSPTNDRASQVVSSFIEKRLKIKDELLKIFHLFSKEKEPLSKIIRKFILSALDKKGKTVILNLSSDIYSQDIKKLLVRDICKHLYKSANNLYKESVSFNTLVVFDEAHNFAPKETKDEIVKQNTEEIVKSYIETRKFGLGWMVISTRISNLHTKLFEHSRVKLLGYNLHTGSDGNLLKESFGSDIVNIYKLFPDPNDPILNKKDIVFMIDGPINVLSRGNPDFIKIFDIQSFKLVNQLSPMSTPLDFL